MHEERLARRRAWYAKRHPPRELDGGYSAIHQWLNSHFAKTGECEECGENVGASGPRGTQWAFQRHGEPHTRERSDYRELCPSCHLALDAPQRLAARS